MTRSKMHTKESMLELLAANDKALVRGLLVIHALQTSTEKLSGFTGEQNGVGFSKAHSEFATSLVNFYLRRKYLSPKQMQALRKLMKRYAGQLARVANGEIVNPYKPTRPALVAPPEVTPEVTPEVVSATEEADRLGLDDDEREPVLTRFSELKW